MFAHASTLGKPACRRYGLTAPTGGTFGPQDEPRGPGLESPAAHQAEVGHPPAEEVEAAVAQLERWAGGSGTDVWDDRSFLIPPFNPDEALHAVQSLRMWPLLAGFRGSEPVAVDEVARALRALGRLALDVPEVCGLDVNPLLVGPEGAHMVDVKLRLSVPEEADMDVARQMRPR